MGTRSNELELVETSSDGQIDRLASRDRDVVRAARTALGAAGANALPLLFDGLAHQRWRVRAECLNLLSLLTIDEPERWLLPLLSDAAAGVRREAIHAVVRLHRRGVHPAAVVLDTIFQLMRTDRIPRVRRVAGQALGLLPRGSEMIERARECLAGESDTRLLYNARWAFPAEARGEITRLRSQRQRRAQADVRRRQRLEELQLESCTSEALVERLGSPDWEVAGLAAEVLFHRGKLAMEPLLAGISHGDPRVRACCAGLMDHLGDSQCVEPLSQALHDPDVHVRRAALHSLSCKPCKEAPLEGDLVGPLVERALHDRNRRVRHVATLALGSQDFDPRAVAALQQILGSTTDVVLRSRARHALSQQMQQLEPALPATEFRT